MKAVRAMAALLLVAAAFAVGYFYRGGMSGPADSNSSRKVLYWVDPMHPAYKSDKPGIAPDCGMKLVPVYAEGSSQAADSPVPPGGMPPGTVRITPERQQLIGVRLAAAEMSSGPRTFRTVGRVQIDESRIGRIRAKVDGWVEDVFVDYVGQLVKKNDALMTFSSSELEAAERDLLLAGGELNTNREPISPHAFDQTDALQAARHRLEIWGMTPAQINRVQASGEPLRTLTVYSPVTGYVSDLRATPGSAITPDTDLFTIVDTSQVEVTADVFEYEIPNIHLGDLAQIQLRDLPGKAFTGRIQYIAPQVDASSPTYKVRLQMGNPGLALSTGSYAEVEFTVQEPRRLSVPASAVLNAGERSVVYVDRGDGYFEPRSVETGARNADRVEILSGLKPGENVAASGGFLIDSESRLKSPGARKALPLASGVKDVGEN